MASRLYSTPYAEEQRTMARRIYAISVERKWLVWRMHRSSRLQQQQLVGGLGAERKQLATAVATHRPLSTPPPACRTVLSNKGRLTASHACDAALTLFPQHHVVVPKQPSHQHYVTVHQPAPTATLGRERRRHRGGFAHLSSPPRVLHREGSSVSAMAATRPASPATTAGAAAIRFLSRATTGPGCARGTRRRAQ